MAYILGIDETTRAPSLWYKAKNAAPNNGDVLTWVAGNNQWEAVAPTGLPAGTDRHVLTYDGVAAAWQSEYPGIVNETENRTFTILDQSATEVEINAALTNYKEVYLEPGIYNCANAITVPASKKLTGLGTMRSAPLATLLFAGSPATSHVILQGGELRNLVVSLSGAAHTQHGVESTSIYSVVEDVFVSAATTANFYGFYGSFMRLSRWRVGSLDGLYLTAPATPADRTIIESFVVVDAPTYGIRLGSVNRVLIQNGRIVGSAGFTDYGIYLSEVLASALEDITIENVTVSEPGITGFHLVGTAGFDITIHINLCRVAGLTGTTDRGFYSSYADRSTWTNCYANYCNGTSAVIYGAFCVENSDHITMANCAGAYSTNTNNADFWFNVVNYSTFTGLNSRGSYNGAWWYNATCFGNAISGVAVRDQTTNTAYPFYYSGGDAAISSVTAYNPAGAIVFSGNRLAVSGITSYNSGNIAIALNANYSTYASINAYSATSYGITTAGGYSTYSGLMAYSCASVGIYINTGSTRSSFTGLTATSNTSYGVQIVNGTDYIQISGVEVAANGAWGFYAGQLRYSNIGNVLTHGNTANGGFFIGTNDNVTICNVNAYANTGTGYSRGTSPTTANSSTSAIITSKSNTVAQYATSANWNTNGEY